MGQKFALIIATAEYQDTGLAQLAAPGLDAHDFAGALQAAQIGAFDGVQTLLNETEAPARRAIARFFAGRKPDDLLLLYFSGHGVRDDHGQLYLAVSDTDRTLLSATAIPAAFINEQMNLSRSRRQVLILDCCNSGAFAYGSKAALGGSMGIAAAFEGTGYGRVVLTATDATQYAWEGDQALGEAANSVFTHFLVKGLETGLADANHDGRITLDELYDYVYEQVVTQTPRQTPRKFTYNQQGELVIAQNPRPISGAVELPPELRQALESPLVSVREAAVTELSALLRGSHRGLVLAALEALEKLTQDDSRRVSSAAAVVLAANAGAQRLAHQEAVRRDVLQAEQVLRAQQQLGAEQAAAPAAPAPEPPRVEDAQPRQRAGAAVEAEARHRAAAQAALPAEHLERERQARPQEDAARRAAEAEQEARERASQTQRLDRGQLNARLRAAVITAPAAVAPQPEAAPPAPADVTEPGSRRAVASLPSARPAALLESLSARLASAGLPLRLPAWPAVAAALGVAIVAVAWGYATVLGDWAYVQITHNFSFDQVYNLAVIAALLIVQVLGGLAAFAVLAWLRAPLRGVRALVGWGAWCFLTVLGLALYWLLFKQSGWPGEPILDRIIFAGLPALAVGWALFGWPRFANLAPLALVVAGWVVAHLANHVVYDGAGWSPFQSGVLLGAIGFGVTLWQAGRPAAATARP